MCGDGGAMVWERGRQKRVGVRSVLPATYPAPRLPGFSDCPATVPLVITGEGSQVHGRQKAGARMSGEQCRRLP